MKDKGRIVVCLLVFALLATPLAGSFSAKGYDAEEPVEETSTRQEDESLILRVAMQDDIKTTNPLVATDRWTHDVIDWLYDTPVRLDEEDELIPYIAVGTASRSADLSSIDWSDCTVGDFDYNPASSWQNASIKEATIFYDFTDVTWHDGTQMDIRDVLFSYHVAARLDTWDDPIMCLKDMGGNYAGNYSETHWLHIYEPWESYDGLKAALTFRLQTPYVDFFENTLAVKLLPEHIWGTLDSHQPLPEMKIWLDDGYAADYYTAWSLSDALAFENPSPVGSGPFKWNRWQKGVTIKIVVNRDHFYKEGFEYETYDNQTGKSLAKQPTIEAIVFKIYKVADSGGGPFALRNNEVDYLAYSIPTTFVQELMNDDEIGIKQSMEKAFYYLGYNMRLPSFGYDDNGDDNGKVFRKAVAHCIDKQTIVQRLLQCFGLPGDGPVSSISTWYNTSVQRYPFDPQEAIDILTEAGYQLTNGPGSTPGPGNWWLNPDGSPIGSAADGNIEILTPPADYDPIRAQAGLMMASQMQEVGINAESIAMDYGTIIERVNTKSFDMYILDYKIDKHPSEYMYNYFHSSNAAAGLNYVGYHNESFDNLIENARETEEYNESQQYIFDAQAAISEDLPLDVLFYRTNIEAYRSYRFTGWENDGSGTIFNRKSIENLKPPSNMWLNAQFVNTALAVMSEGQMPVEVKVTAVQYEGDGTLARTPAENAWVSLAVSNGTLSQTSGTTDANGIFRTTYTAPYVPPDDGSEYYQFDNGVNVLLEIKTAIYEDYDDAWTVLELVTVYPNDVDFLVVNMEADPDVVGVEVEVPVVMPEGGTRSDEPGVSMITVTVTDPDGYPVEGAEIDMLVDPADPSLEGTGITDADGKAVYTFTIYDLWYDELDYRVSVLALKEGYENGSQSMMITVYEIPYEPPPPPPPKTDYLPLIVMAVMLPTLLTIASIVLIRGKD